MVLGKLMWLQDDATEVGSWRACHCGCREGPMLEAAALDLPPRSEVIRPPWLTRPVLYGPLS